jgi:replicative DNA helicase
LGKPVFLVSLEMTRAQVLRRLWARVGRVAPSRLRRPHLATFVEEQYVIEAEQIVRQWPLHIYDQSTVRLEQLTGMLRTAIRKHQVQLFIVDFAQIVKSGGRDIREQVSNVSGDLTAIAKGEGVHLMLLSQLSRKTRAEWNRPPRLSDLRESGALEQNAHCVVLIHRPFNEATGKMHTRAAFHDELGCELVIAKQREGETGAYPVAFNEDTLGFEG